MCSTSYLSKSYDFLLPVGGAMYMHSGYDTEHVYVHFGPDLHIRAAQVCVLVK